MFFTLTGCYSTLIGHAHDWSLDWLIGCMIGWGGCAAPLRTREQKVNQTAKHYREESRLNNFNFRF